MAGQNKLRVTLLRTFQGTLIVGLLLVNIYYAGKLFNLFERQLETPVAAPAPTSNNDTGISVQYEYGFPTSRYTFFEQKVKPNEFLSTLLENTGLSKQKVFDIIQKTKRVFDLRTFRAGKRYDLIYEDICKAPIAMVYKPSIYDYIKFDFKDNTVQKITRPLKTRVESTSGIVRGSLWQSMEAGGNSWELISLMEEALGWAVDFYHINEGDKYKLIYEQKYVDGKKAGIGRLLGAYYKSKGQEDTYSLWYENEKYKGYYDLTGHAARSRFLKSPVKFARISSRYNRHRFHPILKRRRPHLGTDYAAPYGTPILAVGDGIVTIATRRGGNGRYVKIKHDKTYQTQYLHMSRFAKGIKRGAHVRQGQVIGYIGSSGLSTGPHVCFRFWKNGRQVNHLKLHFPASKPLPPAEKDDFLCTSKPIVQMLNDIHFIKDHQGVLAQNSN